MTRKELKQRAKQAIEGNILMLFLIGLVQALIFGVVNIVPFLGQIFVGIVLLPAAAVAMIALYLNMTTGVAPTVGDFITELKAGIRKNVVVANLLMAIYLILWSLLFSIPGIIKTYSYSMTMYILKENPELTAKEAITKSREMMDGHKLELFLLQWSFFWWWLLVVVTLGIAALYVGPYVNATMAEFYNAIKGPQAAPADSYGYENNGAYNPY